MRRKLLAIFAAVALLLTFVPVVSASYWSLHESSCGQYMVTNSACFKENANGGGDILLLIQGSPTYMINLGNIPTPSGTQCLGLFANTHWSDCVSWVAYNIASGYELCGWRDSSYGNPRYLDIGGPANGSMNITGDANDSISSLSLEPVGGGHC
jgi:hypothetical protein